MLPVATTTDHLGHHLDKKVIHIAESIVDKCQLFESVEIAEHCVQLLYTDGVGCLEVQRLDWRNWFALIVASRLPAPIGRIDGVAGVAERCADSKRAAGDRAAAAAGGGRLGHRSVEHHGQGQSRWQVAAQHRKRAHRPVDAETCSLAGWRRKQRKRDVSTRLDYCLFVCLINCRTIHHQHVSPMIINTLRFAQLSPNYLLTTLLRAHYRSGQRLINWQ